jgi:hypothetical protein
MMNLRHGPMQPLAILFWKQLQQFSVLGDSFQKFRGRPRVITKRSVVGRRAGHIAVAAAQTAGEVAG